MGKLVILKFQKNVLQEFNISLAIIGSEDWRPEVEEQGLLPPIPDELTTQVKNWKETYRKLSQRTRKINPGGIELDGTLSNYRSRCKTEAIQLVKAFNEWLKLAQGFQSVDSILREYLSLDEHIQVILSTDDQDLQNLPWNQWSFIEHYRHAEIGFSPLKSRRRVTQPSSAKDDPSVVNILVVLGDSKGIDISSDGEIWKELETDLGNAKVKCLEECDRKELHDVLTSQTWQILFFAGHSETNETGIIHLKNDSLSLEELKNSLQRSIERGLQIAFFNSCDGLGLAHALNEFNIPSTIVMREQVNDDIAKAFLKHFLDEFSKRQPLFQSVRYAREKLEGLGNKYPCADWLPVLWQNPTTQSFTWPETIVEPESTEQEPEEISNKEETFTLSILEWLKYTLPSVLVISLLVASLMMGIRYLGWLQASELNEYDRFMNMRPFEQADRRILVVGATASDLEKYGDPIPDGKLAEVIQTIDQYDPKVIGLDMLLSIPVLPGRDALVKELKTNTKIIGACFVSHNDVDNSEAPPPAIAEKNVGFVDLHNDDDILPGDGTLRRYLLSEDDAPLENKSKCQTKNSFALLVIDKYLQENGKPEIAPDEKYPDHWRIDTIRLPRLKKHNGGYANFTDHGHQILINYRRLENQRTLAQNVSFQDILNKSKDSFDEAWIKDRVVIIGNVAPRKQDEHHTPYGNINGPDIHGHVISQLLSRNEDGRPLIHWWPRWVDFLWFFSCFLSTGILFIYLDQFLHRSLMTGLSIGIIWATCYFSFRLAGLWLPLIPVVLGILLNNLFVFANNYYRRFL